MTIGESILSAKSRLLQSEAVNWAEEYLTLLVRRSEGVITPNEMTKRTG